MEWTDSGYILATRKHGESGVIVELFCRAQGRHLGLVRGGGGARLRPLLQPGNLVKATWRARLSEHLGQFSLDGEALSAAEFIADPLALAALSTLNAQLRLLPERDPHPAMYDGYQALHGALRAGADWAAAFVLWEHRLLRELGFGLDLSECAGTGARDELIYVSPKSGRAVSAGAGAPYRAKLLALPAFLRDEQPSADDWQALEQGFRLTSFFLRRHLFEPRRIAEPQARERMLRLLAKRHAAALPEP